MVIQTRANTAFFCLFNLEIARYCRVWLLRNDNYVISQVVVVVYLLSCVTLVTPWTVSHQAPLSLGFFQARILEWVAVFFSRGSSQPRDQTHISCVSCIGRQILYPSATQEALGDIIGVTGYNGNHSAVYTCIQ